MKSKVLIIVSTIILLIISCTPAPAPTSTPIPTSQPTETSTPLLHDVSFLAFHDFNGNGVWNEEIGELLLSGVKISFKDYECITSNERTCVVDHVTEGQYDLKINTDGSDVDNLDYLFWENGETLRKNRAQLEIPFEDTVNIALGQGPIPLPIGSESYYGLWDGKGNYGVQSRYGMHWAIDIMVYGNGPQTIYAPISGQIEKNPGATTEKPFGDTGHVVIIHRSDVGNFNINIGHLTGVFVKHYEEVKRGDPIGYINPDLYAPNISGYDHNGLPRYYQGPGAAVISGTEAPHIDYGIFGENGPDNHRDDGWGMFNPLSLFPVTNYAYPWMAP